MTTALIQPGEKFADWSYARNVMPGLQALGINGGSRYLSPGFSPQITSGKCTSIPERDEAFARGFWQLLNWEAAAADVYGGAPKGIEHGRMCLAQLRIMQYDVDPRLKISVSVDVDARFRLQLIGEYLIAFHDQLAEYKPQMNAYGGSFELNYMVQFSPGWLTTSHAWSDPAVWSAINSGDWSNPLLDNICAFQTAVGSTSAYDIDVIIKPMTVWTGIGADPINQKPPTITGEEMQLIMYRAAGRADALVAFDGSGMSAFTNPGGPVPGDWGNTMVAYGPDGKNYAPQIDCDPAFYDGVMAQCNNKRENAAITATIGLPDPIHVAIISEPTRTTT